MVNGTQTTRSTGKRKATRATKGNAPGTRRPRATTKRQAVAANRGTTETETPIVEHSTDTQSLKRARKPQRATRNFSVSERIAAVTAALTASMEHPQGKAGLAAAISALNGAPIHMSTLHDWLVEYKPVVLPVLLKRPMNEQVETQYNATMEELFKIKALAAKQLLDENKANDAKYDKAGIVYGIAMDKINDAVGMTADEIHAWNDWRMICNALGFNAVDMCNNNTHRLQELQQRRLTADDRAMLSPGDQDTSTD